MPFVQGQYRHELVTIAFTSECGHCGRPMRIEIGSDLRYTIQSEASRALVFVPLIDFGRLRAKSIIDDF